MKKRFDFNAQLKKVNTTEKIFCCWHCGELFTAGELSSETIHERLGEFWGLPCYEDRTYYYCPKCNISLNGTDVINLTNMAEIKNWIEDNSHMTIEYWLNFDAIGNCVKIDEFDLSDYEDIEILSISYTDHETIRLDFMSNEITEDYKKGLVY